MPLSVGTRLGSYEIVAPLGAGGMGEVWRARDTTLKRDVAIKVLPAAWVHDADRLARFQREAQLLAAMNHPNIAQIHGLEQRDGVTGLVMELVEGPTLDDRIRQGAVPLDEALAIARQIADALDAAHERGIVHRDLKPANVKLREDGTAKVLDFGLAKATDAAFASGASDRQAADLQNSPTMTSPAMTQHGVILGTAAYMSPEQAKGRPVDKRADIWAFGVVLYEMVTGRRLFQGDDLTETLANVVKDRPDLSVAPVELQRLLARCLEKDPRKRLRDIGDVWDLLDTRGAPGATAPGRARSIWPWAIAATAVLAALGTLAFVALRPSPPPAPLYEFAVDTPAPANVGSSFALSPDGREVAFSARLPSIVGPDSYRLWVRSLAGGPARELPGTQGARYPFWSPDGRFIGFFAQGKLKKIAEGMPAQTLCDAADGRGGTWSADGVILFAPSAFGQIQRVSERGGTPTAVTAAGAADASPVRRFPWFLPGGRQFLYSDAAAGSERSGIYVGSIDGGEPRRLLPDDSNAIYVPPLNGAPGVILFVREGNLMAQGFDPSRRELTGEMVVVAEGLSISGNRGHYGFSAGGGGSLLYRRTPVSGGPILTQLAWRDRAGKVLESLGPPARIVDIALSPDDSQAALGVFDTDTTADIWLFSLRRGEMSRLTSEPGIDLAPVWSADGQRVAFSAERLTVMRLHVKDADGKRPEVPVWPGAPPTATGMIVRDWSPDGQFLLFQARARATMLDLWLLPMKTAAPQAIPYLQTPFVESRGRFSPDGRWLAYESNESGRFEIYIRPFPAADRKWQISTGSGHQPLWSRDGRELYYLEPQTDSASLMAVTIAAGEEIKAGAPRTLFKGVDPLGPYDVARDGRFLMAMAVADDNQANAAQTSTPTLVLVTDWRAKLAR